jgi:hypothetical protein
MKIMHWLCILLLPLAMGSGLYRWTDENGVVSYSQIKPQGIDATRIELQGSGTMVERSPEPMPDLEAPAVELSPQQKAHLERLEALERARQEEIARIRQSNCERAEQTLAQLQSGPRIRVRETSGAERVMPEDEQRHRIAEAQRAIAEHCVQPS